MARPTIPDKDIPNADPEQLIYCFTPWVQKVALRYRDCLDRISSKDMDDLLQVGSLALLTAQKKYDPEGGAKFLSFSFYYISNAMRRELGFTCDGRLPAEPLSLDAPLTDDSDICLKDAIPDRSEPIEERCERTERAEELHRAIARLKNEKQKELIRRVDFEEQNIHDAAVAMNMKDGAAYSAHREALNKLRRDRYLKALCVPVFSASLSRFRRTWMSVIESEIIWKEQMFDAKFGVGAYITR